MENDKIFFSRLIANPQAARMAQERLTSICTSYPWFTMAKAIRIPLIKNSRRKIEYINSLSLNLYQYNYIRLQQGNIDTNYIKQFLFVEKENSDTTISNEELNDGIVIYESGASESEIFPKGRIVLTNSGLFYSEETEGYKIIKEVIAVNQKVDKFGKKINTDKTSEIIDMFLSKKLDKVVYKPGDIKGDNIDLSDKETDEILTESMAKIYRLQGLFNESIEIYSKLSLKNPEKSRYFAEIISSIEEEKAKSQK